MRKFAVIALALSVYSNAGNGAQFDGDFAISICLSDNPGEVAVCSGYVAGLYDGIIVSARFYKQSAPFCVPKNMTNGHVREVFSMYLRNNPEKSRWLASELFVRSIREAFPCGK
jgi:hypothetical protein